MRSGPDLKIQNPKSKIQNGFTLVEMLTVIGIIVLLVSILLPVVGAVRTKGHDADTKAMLARIATGIQSYYADFNAYPGPIGNDKIGVTPGPTIGIRTSPGVTMTLGDTSKITQAENGLLGLLGGLTVDSSSAAGNILFDPTLIGQGPMSLNPRNPKKYRAYMDKVSMTSLHGDPTKGYKFRDDAAEADDTCIPEFVDKFPDPLPILYMRANRGATGIVSNVAPSGTTPQEQYDLRQIIGYTKTNIGLGKDLAQSEYRGRAASEYAQFKHGLHTVDRNTTIIENPPRPPGEPGTYVYPYDLHPYMRHPSIANTPRQKDGFILISAGPDRVYGTKDDAQYPANR
jgi:prepilin-type N-terminal cleavage/methylation domain-containing protein